MIFQGFWWRWQRYNWFWRVYDASQLQEFNLWREDRSTEAVKPQYYIKKYCRRLAVQSVWRRRRRHNRSGRGDQDRDRAVQHERREGGQGGAARLHHWAHGDTGRRRQTCKRGFTMFDSAPSALRAIESLFSLIKYISTHREPAMCAMFYNTWRKHFSPFWMHLVYTTFSIFKHRLHVCHRWWRDHPWRVHWKRTEERVRDEPHGILRGRAGPGAREVWQAEMQKQMPVWVEWRRPEMRNKKKCLNDNEIIFSYFFNFHGL